MATFPALEPATRSYDFGLFPLTEEPTASAGSVRFRHSITSQNYQLSLSYVDLTDAEASLIRQHFQGQGGGYRSFQLPPIIWRGHSFSGNIVPTNTRWRYIEIPEEEHRSAGYVSLTVTLGSDGTVNAEMGLQDQDPGDLAVGGSVAGASLTVTCAIQGGGGGGGGSGAAMTVTCTFEAGAAVNVVDGLEITVTCTFEAGAATGD
jgi:hypothetical protein